MAKYSFEFKEKILHAYLQGEGGYGYLTKVYGVSNKMQGYRCVKAYQTLGDEGLMSFRKKESYSFKFKLHVVELYLTTEVSYQELALSVGINNPPLISKWINNYRIAVPDALKPKRKGRRRKIDKPAPHEFNNNAEYIKQLED